jgi:hypothetical protein
MTGPWWLSGQVSHCSFKVSPALTGIEFDVDLPLLWHAISDVPKLAGSTKPEESLAKRYITGIDRVIPLSWFKASQPAVAGTWLAGR